MRKVLIVDDSKTILAMLKMEFMNLEGIEAIYAQTYKEAVRKIRENSGDIHVALLDVNLPDAQNGEVIVLANSHNIPTIVLTGSMNDKIKELINKNDVLSYVVKGTPKSTNHAVRFVQRALRYYDTTVLVVDDSKLYRQVLCDILKKNHINVLEAENGEEALGVIKNSKENISVLFTDLEMPVMDGLELTIRLRESYDKDQLGIVAISSVEDEETVSNFLKYGANDFITKPFTKSEVLARMNSILELLDLFKKITDMANKDFLTGAYNRRYFFDAGEAVFLKAKRKESPVAVAMLDIDKFKNINDTYGHDVGDIAIKEIKRILDKNLRASDLMARFGGEEFCIVLEDISLEDTKALFEKIRENFENNVIDTGDLKIKYTVSFGVAFGLLNSLDEMVALSDAALYDSKENGRNQVTVKEA